MKRYGVLLGIILVSTVLITPMGVKGALMPVDELWALIICGWPYYGHYMEEGMQLDPQYMRDVLVEHYSFSEVRLIEYLSPPNKDKNWLRGEIRNWLGSRSDSNDLVFIFFMSHGVGTEDHGGRPDGSEGDPIDELDGYDEGLWLKESAGMAGFWYEYYWDDEFKDDLASVEYGKLVLLLQGCYTGGFVSDLSGPNRIIITPCNETTLSHGHLLIEGYPLSHVGYFSRAFIDALNRTKSFTDADITTDDKVTIREAFEYAWRNDPKRISGKETPQLDDNGDGIANTWMDGALSLETYFGTETLKRTDLNLDRKIDMHDISIAAQAFGSYPGHPKYDIRAAVVCDDSPFSYEDERVTMRDISAICRDFGIEY